MGYETSSIDFYKVRVRPNKLTEVAEAIAAHARGEGQHHWMVGSLKLSADGTLLWDDAPIGKWKSHELFISDLASWCSGGWVSFWSREGDGAAWAYEFDGVGGFRECSARRVAALKAAAWQPPTLPATLTAVITSGTLLGLPGLWLSLWAFAAMLALTWLVSIPLVLWWPQVLDWCKRRHAANVRANEEVLRSEEANAPTILAQCRAEARAHTDEVSLRHQELAHRLQAMARPNRLQIGQIAVEYLGWEGTVHTFAFVHPGFVAAFRAVNASKKVW